MSAYIHIVIFIFYVLTKTGSLGFRCCPRLALFQGGDATPPRPDRPGHTTDLPLLAGSKGMHILFAEGSSEGCFDDL